MDMSLSFRITSKFVFMAPALFKASNAIPALMAPSPITGYYTPVSFPPAGDATAIPRAALMEVLDAPYQRRRIRFRHAAESRQYRPAYAICHAFTAAGKNFVGVSLVYRHPIPNDRGAY